MTDSSQSFNLTTCIALFGGLSLFLLGLDMMSANLKKVAGHTMKLVLEKATDNHLFGVLIGALVTAVINSSTATTSILVSFVQSQLMSFERSVAVIMGANIGSTVTGQLVAFDITKWSLAIVSLGYLAKLLAQRTKTKNIAYIFLGLGLLFFGLEVMSDSMKFLRDSEYFLNLMQSLENVWFGIAVGAVFTALIHSSGASIGIVIGLAMQGLISIEAAVPLIFGANIGTCFTCVVASIGAGANAQRVAAAHVLFNVTGVLAFMFWIPEFISLVKWLSPENDTPRLIANAQSYFNIMATILWFPFIKQLEFLSRITIPDDKNPTRGKYVFPRVRALSKTPELLLLQSIDAIKQYKNIVKEMLWISRDYFVKQEKNKTDDLVKLREFQQEFRIDILDFLSRVGKLRLAYSHVSQVLNHITLVNEIEHVAYKLESSLETLHNEVPKFDESYIGLEEYFQQTVKCFSKSCNAVLNGSSVEAKRIISNLESLKPIEEELRNRSVENIHTDPDPKDYETEKLNLWVLEFLRSVNGSSKRICQILVDQKLRAKQLV